MTRSRKRAMIIMAVIAVGVAAGAWGLWAEKDGQAHLRACAVLEPGGPRIDLIRALGSPTASELNPAGTRLVLLFRSPLFGARPIRAVVNVRDDVVMEIDCGDGLIRIYDKY